MKCLCGTIGFLLTEGTELECTDKFSLIKDGDMFSHISGGCFASKRHVIIHCDFQEGITFCDYPAEFVVLVDCVDVLCVCGVLYLSSGKNVIHGNSYWGT